MGKFFKKEKKTEEEVSNKVEKSVRNEESSVAADDWMNYTPTETKVNNAKKKTSSDKDKKNAYEEKESENTALIQSLQEENKALQLHVDELEHSFNRIVDLQNEVQSLKSLLDERDSLQDELVRLFPPINFHVHAHLS